MHRLKRKTIINILLLTTLLLGTHLVSFPQEVSVAHAAELQQKWDSHMLTEPFVRSRFDDLSPSGHSIATDCQDPEGDYPYTPYDWPNATALLDLEQRNGESTVTITVQDARPDTYFTLWLRLQGTDKNGNVYGGNPLDGSPGVALAPTTDLPKLLKSSGPGNGSDEDPNGFYTDADGNAVFSIDLDFPIINGSYPFHRFETFDPTDERLPAEEPAIYPVAIVGKDGPFTLRMVSHCVDGLGHGLGPAMREWWFLWKFE